MAISVVFVLLFYNVLLWSAQPAAASGGEEKALILQKLNLLQQKLDDIEHSMKEAKQATQAREASMQSRLSKFEARLGNLEDIMRDVKTTTTNKLDELEKKLFPQENNQTNQAVIYKSCKEVLTKVSGKYEIQPEPNQKPLTVYCEQTAYDGGWTVFQYRFNGQVDFFRNWTEYRDGFGDLDGEFWLGLEHVHKLTSARKHELMVEVKDYHGNYGYTHYDHFVIGSESENFKIKNVGNYDGTAGDDFISKVGNSFTTIDRDNDTWRSNNCAVDQHGAWWYRACSYSNLNGPYGNPPTNRDKAMTWFEFKSDSRAMSYSRMMIRESN